MPKTSRPPPLDWHSPNKRFEEIAAFLGEHGAKEESDEPPPKPLSQLSIEFK